MKLILSLDGGYIRNLSTLTLLEYMENKVKSSLKDERIKFSSLFDMIVGSSTSSIISSLMLMHNDGIHSLDVSDIRKEYETFLINGFVKDFNPFKSKYKESAIESELLRMFDHKRLNDLNKHSFFYGYETSDQRVVLFHTNEHEFLFLKDVIHGCLAAPTLFSPYSFRNGIRNYTLMSGGFFHNNPSMYALTESTKLFECEKQKDIMIISVGSGYTEHSFNNKATDLLGLAITTNTDETHHHVKELFNCKRYNHNYKRINVRYKETKGGFWDFSEKNVRNMIKDTERYIEENESYLNVLCRELCDLNYLI